MRDKGYQNLNCEGRQHSEPHSRLLLRSLQKAF